MLRSLALLVLLSVPAFAAPTLPPLESQSPLSLDQVVQGALTVEDRPRIDGSPSPYAQDAFRFQGKKGQRVRLVLQSSEFDPELTLNLGGTEPAAQAYGHGARSDDGEPEQSEPAQLEVTLPASGTWTVLVSNSRQGQLGRYALRLSLVPGTYPVPTLEAQVEPMQLGQVVRGRLDETDALTKDWGRSDVYRFEGHEGQRVVVALPMDSNAARASLHFGSRETESLSSIGGLSAVTIYELEGKRMLGFKYDLPKDGTYFVVVQPGSNGWTPGADYLVQVYDLNQGEPQEQAAQPHAAEQEGASGGGDMGAFAFGFGGGSLADASYFSFSGLFHMGKQLTPSVGVGGGAALSLQDVEDETFYGVLAGPTLRWGAPDDLSLTLLVGPSFYFGTLPDPDASSLGVGGRVDLCVISSNGFCLGGFAAGQLHGGLDPNLQYGVTIGAQW
ncbi:hypothetical protein FGE12_06335 [Aggregicoccus sp. 17bor-14]|uniref:hypothetical protein n=1 Tax=Myxococcaceae TaxID=31 RepID=UPI00129C3005|nr:MULTISPECIES: hypothetical protein [Myxococcaceae]MBF5042005.1 hypothetical protein [Simulacricoccus sp. 17bor-14]MRI87785.1 hypothetical protein [Aggregicoccus sp. 17bor-14]